MGTITNDVDFYNLIKNAYKNNLPFVAFRKPNTIEIELITQKNKQLYYTKNYQESGFVFAPFDTNKPSILFPLSKSTRYCCQLSKSTLDDKKIDIKVSENPEISKLAHIALIDKGIDFLIKNDYKKVVLSRKETINNKNFKIVETYKKLLTNYKNAFAYCWFHPKVGLWLGATPENLLKVEEKKFSTMALASTQVYKNPNSEPSDFKDITWGKKEIAEQQYVTDFILEQLNINVEVSKPYTVKAGNLLHLRTDISGKLTKQFTLKNTIDLLHPTPAVCGVPKQKAKEFILLNENYNRQFYTGFLGELNLKNTSDLYVNLRCMQVLKNTIGIYIGGGITTESDPESEWEETVSKSKTIMKVL